MVITSNRTIDPAGVADHYDELDLFYREIWGEHLHHGLWLTGSEDPEAAVVQLVRLVAQKARISEGTRVCDIGCGYGAAARLVVRERNASVTAVTISARQHSYAKNVDPSGNPNYLRADWSVKEPLPELLPDSFDAAFAIESSEHMSDKVQFFSRTLDILRSGGRLVVCSWLAAEVPSNWQRSWLLEPICREGRMPNLLNAGELVNAARRAGFTEIDRKELSSQVSPTWSIVLARFGQRLVFDSRYRSFLLDRRHRNRIFGVTLLRIWLAYKTRAMKYAIFTFAK